MMGMPSLLLRLLIMVMACRHASCVSNEMMPVDMVSMGFQLPDGSNTSSMSASGRGVMAATINQINANLTAIENDSMAGMDEFSMLEITSEESGDDSTSSLDATGQWHAMVENVTRACLTQCITEESEYRNEFGVKCSSSDNRGFCYHRRCIRGCEQWWLALQEFESCQEACASKHFYPHDLPCMAACEAAQSNYWHQQRRAVESIVRSTKPRLLLSGGEASSLILKWPIGGHSAYLAARPFNIQHQRVDERRQEPSEASWINLPHYNCNDNFGCEILDGLMPFTSYRFRFEFLFGEGHDELLHSAPTSVIKTPAAGAPTSEPIIEASFPLDQHRIAITWQAGPYTNGLLRGYQLTLALGQQELQTTVVPVTKTQHIFTGLQAATNYTIRLAMLNAESVGPLATVHVQTRPLPVAKTEAANQAEPLVAVLVVGEYSVHVKRLEPFMDTQLILHMDNLISDCALHLALKQLFVVDVAGTIQSCLLDNAEAHTALPLRLQLASTQEGFRAQKLSVDWLRQRLYLAGEMPERGWTVLSSDLEGGGLQVLASNLSGPIQQLSVDPINGWLFWTDEHEGLVRLDLATWQVRTLFPDKQIGHFVHDFERFTLHAFNRSDNALYELSYDGSYAARAEMGGKQSHALLNGEWLSFWPLAGPNSGGVLATNGTHLLHQAYRTNDNELWPLKHLEWATHIWPWQLGAQRKHIQPQPQPQPQGGPPRRLAALLTSNVAQISWEPPPLRTNLQSAGAWQRWEYELEIMDVASNSAFNIRNIRSNYFKVEKLQPSNLYRLRVRVANMEAAHEFSEPLLTRTWPLGGHKLLWALETPVGGLWETSELGGNAEARHLAELPGGGIASSFLQINGSIYYVSADAEERRLLCRNVMHPEVNCSFEATHVAGLAFDWRGGKLYWSDRRRNCVLRINLDGSERQLLPIFGARQLEIDSYNGLMYFSSGTRLLRCALNGLDEELELFHLHGLEAGVIRALALNLQQQLLFWIVRLDEGEVRLHWLSLEEPLQQNQRQFRTLSHDIVDSSLQYLYDIDSLLWVEAPSSEAVLLRVEALSVGRTGDLLDSHLARLQVPQPGARVRCVRLKSELTFPRDPTIVPSAVERASIRIDDGYWDDFNVRWDAIPAADNFSVQYNVLLQQPQQRGKAAARFQTLTTTEPFVRLTDFQRSRIRLNVTITAQTWWATGPSTAALLHTPGAAPGQPKRLRIFIQRIEQPLQPANTLALVRWDPADMGGGHGGHGGQGGRGNALPVAYRIECWHGTELHGMQLFNQSGRQPFEVTFDGLVAGESYTFQVQAFAPGQVSTSGGGGVGGGEKTPLQAVYVNPDVQSRPRLVYATNDIIAELDLDSGRRRILAHTNTAVEHLVMMQGEQRLLWVNENVELMSCVVGAGQTPTPTPTKLARMRAEVLALTVDWLLRIVYWAELDIETEAVALYQLDLCQSEGSGRVLLGTKMHSTPPRRLLKDLLVLPFSQTLLWLEYDSSQASSALSATLTGLDLRGKAPVPLSLRQALPGTYIKLFQANFQPDLESVNLVDQKGRVCVYDLGRQVCASTMRIHFPAGLQQVEAIDRDAGFVYALANGSIRAYSRRRQALEYDVALENMDGGDGGDGEDGKVSHIYAYNPQPYPPRGCLVPNASYWLAQPDRLQPSILAIEEQQISLALPSLVEPAEEAACTLPMPGTKYTLTLTPSAPQSTGTANETRHFTTNSRLLNVTQLQAFTNYSLQLRATTYYQLKLGQPALQARILRVRTALGTPERPQHFRATALSPTEIRANWSAPAQYHAERIWYEVHWRLEHSAMQHVQHRTTNHTELLIAQLEPDTLYSLWVQAHSSATKFNASSSIRVLTYPAPSALHLLRRTAYNLTLGCLPMSNATAVELVYRPRSAHGEADRETRIQVGPNCTQLVVTPLEPRMRYEFHFALHYGQHGHRYLWPEPSKRYVYETLGDCPSRPGRPQLEHVAGEIFKVYWAAARGHGAPVLEYSLEALQAKRLKREAAIEPLWAEEPHALTDKWLPYCNTSELSCIVRDMHSQRLQLFRVRARNEPYGWGPYSEESVRVAEPFVSPEKRNSLIFAIIAPAAIVSSFVLILVAVRTVQVRRQRANKLLAKSRPSIWSNMSMQQQQQQQHQQQQQQHHQLVRSNNRAMSVVSHSTRFGGGSPLSDADIALLPQIKWEQVTLLNFLGSGAFGEVYEGTLRYPPPADDQSGTDVEMERVAIKCLRKGASEFSELLQEAQLMSNFKHENIVRLIGICFDTDSISIIMEFMEGGDLLSYLRESRPNATRQLASLQLLDLMTMCIDVATGCTYLEDMHFVHRDLACRNCLVSSRVACKRVVKIGDFGLARDIYKSDYYRKEGEGLLPVRWMSPESLVDGVFTTQSDVWAFGVLCWEILTLGHQPYAARNNLEVLNFVKAGGRLEQPDNCPDKLFELLQLCWQTDPDERPSFRRCLNTLLTVKTDVRRVSLGYNLDDSDYVMYANSNGIVLSSFLSTPLTKLDELELELELEGRPDEPSLESSCSNKHVEGINMKLNMQSFVDTSDAEPESISLSDKLIERQAEHEGNCYVNEGVSKL